VATRHKAAPEPEVEVEPVVFEPAPELEEAVAAAPRWTWDADSADSRVAEYGRWRVRVARLGGTGLWRPFAEYVGPDYHTAEAAESELDELLR
jgi:hypothetical protein